MYFFDELFQFVNCNENCNVVELIESLFNDRENYFQIYDDHVVENVFRRVVFIFDINQKFVKCIFREKNCRCVMRVCQFANAIDYRDFSFLTVIKVMTEKKSSR